TRPGSGALLQNPVERVTRLKGSTDRSWIPRKRRVVPRKHVRPSNAHHVVVGIPAFEVESGAEWIFFLPFVFLIHVIPAVCKLNPQRDRREIRKWRRCHIELRTISCFSQDLE